MTDKKDSITGTVGKRFASAKEAVKHVIKKSREGDQLILKPNMTNQTIDLLLRTVRLTMVRKAFTNEKFRQRHTQWYQAHKSGSYTQLRGDLNGRMNAIARTDADDKEITWTEAKKILEISGVTLTKLTIEFYDPDTGTNITVSSDSNYEAEYQKYLDSKKLPPIDTL